MSNSQNFFKEEGKSEVKPYDWKTVYLQNIGKLLIGIYDMKNDQIILQPSMPGMLLVIYEKNVQGAIVDGWRLLEYKLLKGKKERLTKENIAELNEKYKDAIPRFFQIVDEDGDLGATTTSHLCMLQKIGKNEQREDFR